MKRVAIVSDSAAALPQELAQELGIVTVPMHLEIGGRPVSERDVTPEELVAHLGDGIQTSGPSPGEFLEAIESLDSADAVLVLTVGQRYSSTFNAAVAASTMSDDQKRVRVVDTASAAGGEGLVVLAAAHSAAMGDDIEDVIGRAEYVAGRVRLVAAVRDLKYLVKGGRLPASAASLGSQFGVQVLFELRASGPRPLRPSINHASDRLLGLWRRSKKSDDARLHIAALHSMAPDEAAQLLRAVKREIEPVTAFVGTFGPVMIAHTGPGVIGLSWWWE